MEARFLNFEFYKGGTSRHSGRGRLTLTVFESVQEKLLESVTLRVTSFDPVEVNLVVVVAEVEVEGFPSWNVQAQEDFVAPP